jgi:hypothetical protein
MNSFKLAVALPLKPNTCVVRRRASREAAVLNWPPL